MFFVSFARGKWRHRRRVRQRPASAGECWPVSATPKVAEIRVIATLTRQREEMRRHKMCCYRRAAEDACVGGMSVADNIAFREFDRAPFASGAGGNRAAFPPMLKGDRAL